MAYRVLGDAGAVAAASAPRDRPLRKWLRRYEREGEAGLRARSRRPHRSPILKVGATQEALILWLRRERRLGVKRPRNELRRLHDLRLSAATIHKVLSRHRVSVLPTRRRSRHKPKRYERPVPGERVQMDTCKIRPGLYQFMAIDDCSRFIVAGLARRRSAGAALAFLDQVLEEMPFPIQRVHTDRGAEFFAEDVQHRLMSRSDTVPAYPAALAAPERDGRAGTANDTREFWETTDLKGADVHQYNWHPSHESLHGDTPVDRICGRADKTPLRAAVCDAYDPTKERIQIRHNAVGIALRALK